LVPLIAPTTPAERRRAIAAEAEGFVYLVSTVGVTGEREALPDELTGLIASVREESSVPVAVGFGISTVEQAAAVGAVADGVIIGSRLVREVSAAPALAAGVTAIRGFLTDVRTALAANG
ncbi:MAG: tryptophan synthase subunit alpha, partial [Solirubrobacterales bacterium]